MVDWLLSELEREYDTIVADSSESSTYLGMAMIKEKAKSITLYISGYIERIIAHYANCTTYWEVVTSANVDVIDIDESKTALPAHGAKLFHTTTAQLLFLCKRTRPDTQLPTLFMCTRVQQPRFGDKLKLGRIIGFFKKTRHRRRRLGGVGTTNTLEWYIDVVTSF